METRLMKHEQVAIVGPILKRKIETEFPQVAVDGGIAFAQQPILWVGDGDSVTKDMPHIKMVPKLTQNETDLRFCLNQIHEWGWKELHLFGFLGGRKDHEWANLGEVCQAILKQGYPAKAIFYHEESHRPNLYLFSSGQHSIHLKGLFSVLSFERAAISISGECSYSLENEILMPLSGRGISNEGHGEIHFQANVPLMVIVSKT
jgi:thiamine pyrophosphokinase